MRVVDAECGPEPSTLVLDDPVGGSLRGRHARFMRSEGRALTYRPEVATFAALPLHPTDHDWDDLARLLGEGALADLFSHPAVPPSSWRQVFRVEGQQLIGPTASPATTSDRVVVLGNDDVPEMQALVQRAKPGPFRPRTHELGTYVGMRAGGQLVAMAGERLQPEGWTEISAVCTDPKWRGRGYARAVVEALITSITARGDRPFLHLVEGNSAALRLYEQLGFQWRRSVVFRGFQIPGAAAD